MKKIKLILYSIFLLILPITITVTFSITGANDLGNMALVFSLIGFAIATYATFSKDDKYIVKVKKKEKDTEIL